MFSNFSQRNRNIIIKALLHYYKTDFCLIPQQNVGDELPEILVNFYNNLVEDMKSWYSETSENIQNSDLHSNETFKNSFLSYLNKNVLAAYISYLQEDENFLSSKKDPLAELCNPKHSLDDEATKKIFIVFCGVQFTGDYKL